MITVRSWTEKDRDTLIEWGVRKEALSPDPDCYIFIAEEDGKMLGYAIGRDKWGPKLCVLQSIRAPGRHDAWIELLIAHAENGLKLGNTHAEAFVPEERQCTGIAETPVLMTYLRDRLNLETTTRGVNTATEAKTYRVNPLLTDVLASAKAERDRLARGR